MPAMSATVYVEPVETRTGGWCEHCQLSSLVTVTFSMRLGSPGLGSLSTVTFCHGGADDCPSSYALG